MPVQQEDPDIAKMRAELENLRNQKFEPPKYNRFDEIKQDNKGKVEERNQHYKDPEID